MYLIWLLFFYISPLNLQGVYMRYTDFTPLKAVLNGGSKNYQIIHRRNEVKSILNSKINVGRVGALSKAPQ